MGKVVRRNSSIPRRTCAPMTEGIMTVSARTRPKRCGSPPRGRIDRMALRRQSVRCRGPLGKRVVGDGALDSLLIAFLLPVRGRESVFLIAIEIDDAAVAVVPRVALVLPKNRKLDAIDVQSSSTVRPVPLPTRDVDFNQSLPTFVVTYEGV